MRREGTVSAMNKQHKMERADIVIVGNGIAGLTAAVEARRLVPDLSIVIITEQSHPTINTPALKQFAIGKLAREQLLAYPPGIERTERIHVINARVEWINADSKFVCLSGGYCFGYGSLLITTGSIPTALPSDMPGHNFDGVLTLHCLQDYLDLRRRLPGVHEAVVIGGGTHAIETVTSLLYLDIAVHWLIRGKTFMSRTLDQHASEMVLDSIRRAGAKIYIDTHGIGIVGRVGSVVGVVTNHNLMLPCDLVLACTGTKPVTTLAEHCNIPMIHKNGILVDDQLRTSVRDIYAAGAVAALKNPQTGTYETRPLWHAAVLQGRTVAAAMTGHYELAAQSFGVPWHATQLGELCMLTVGNPQHWTENVITLTNSNKGSYRRLSIVGDSLVGYLSLGPTQPDSLAIKRIIDKGLSIRDVKDALLKGVFDARKYFSQQQSRAAIDMVTSGKLPAINWAQMPTPLTYPSPTTHAILNAYPPHNTDALPSPLTVGNAVGMSPRQTEPLNESIPTFRNLWSYSDKVPAFRARHPSSQALWFQRDRNGQFVMQGER
jgi:NAD(P)H-nitrite reductase large subunit